MSFGSSSAKTAASMYAESPVPAVAKNAEGLAQSAQTTQRTVRDRAKGITSTWLRNNESQLKTNLGS